MLSSQTDPPQTNNEDADLRPHQLSGDQNAEQSVLVSTTETHKANRFLTGTTIIKTVIGSGMLSIPYTLNQMGYVLGTILFLAAALLNQLGTIFLLNAKNLSAHSNYATIFYTIWPNRIAKGISSIIIMLAMVGVCVADLIIFKTAIRKILKDVLEDTSQLDNFYTSSVFLVLIMALCQVPLILVAKIEKLRFMGLCGVIGIVIFIVSFVVFYTLCSLDVNVGASPIQGMNMFPTDWYGAAAAVPNIFLAITFQSNLFPVFKGLKKASDTRMKQTAFCSVLFCALSYLTVGILGYNYVGNGVKPNFLQSLQYQTISAPFYYLLNASFLTSVFFAFPILFFSGRNNFIALAQLFQSKQAKKTEWRAADSIQQISLYLNDAKTKNRRRKAKIRFVVYTVILFVLIVGTATLVDNIEIVFNAVGAICAASLTPLLPCLFYFRLVSIKNQPKTVKFYLSIIIFTIMTPYSIFSIISLYLN